MREFQEKRKFKKIIYSGWLQIILGVILLALIFSTVKVYKKSRISSGKSQEIKEEMAKLEKRNAELGAEAARLESESGKEGEIRKRFDVAKPGEKILVIVDKNSEDVKINGEINNIGFFSKIWHWIKTGFNFKRVWFSGRMVASQATDRSSILLTRSEARGKQAKFLACVENRRSEFRLYRNEAESRDF